MRPTRLGARVSDSRFAYKNGKQVGLKWKSYDPPRVEQIPTPVQKPKKPSKRGENLRAGSEARNDVARFDYQEIADLWSQGLTNDEISEKVGCGHSTIAAALKKVQPEGYTGKPGPRQMDTCQRGHDMAVHGRALKRGGRTCMECKRARDRETWRRKHSV